jgi:hypothetical protein
MTLLQSFVQEPYYVRGGFFAFQRLPESMLCQYHPTISVVVVISPIGGSGIRPGGPHRPKKIDSG